jgi:arsenate reductase-like glutaredoxin family protein
VLRIGRRETDRSDVTIYYNWYCEICRNALALIRHAGIEPTIVEYMWPPPSRTTLLELLTCPELAEMRRAIGPAFGSD